MRKWRDVAMGVATAAEGRRVNLSQSGGLRYLLISE